MKPFNKTLLATGVALALGSVSGAWANPNNHAWTKGDIHQTATLDSTQGGNTSPQASEYSTAWQKDESDHSDNSDQGYSEAKDFGVSANNNSTSTNSSQATADDAAANNGSQAYSDRSDNSDNSDNSFANANDKSASANNQSTANVDNSDNSDHSYADVSGTGAAANGGGDASFSDSHNVSDSYNKDESYASVDHSTQSAAANNNSTAEVHMAIAEAKLDGYVSGNHTDFNNDGKKSDFTYNGNNDASGAVTGGAGVIVFSQNTGQNALTQQNVSTQASLTVN